MPRAHVVTLPDLPAGLRDGFLAAAQRIATAMVDVVVRDVVGEGPQRVWLERHLPRAKFTGALTTGDLAAALASLDLLVHPGEEETCCHALREAGATGLPVVAIGGITPADVPALAATGIAGVAIVRSIMDAERPGAVVQDVLTAFQANRPWT